MNYLSNSLFDLILAASVGTLVLLQAQTGSGKSTMITKKLWLNSKLYSRPILWIVNRTTLKNQAVYDILSQIGVDYTRIDFSIEGYISLDGLVIMSYQYLAERFKSITRKSKIGPYAAKDYYYVIFDEAHYFIADSRFNSKNASFVNIPSVFTDSIHVYMSATLEPVKSLILKLEGACPIEKVYDYPEYHPFKYVDLRYPPLNREHVWINRTVLEPEAPTPDYGYLSVEVIPDNTDKQVGIIINMITDGTIKKIVWFINSIKEGEKISDLLTSLGIPNALLFAENSNKKLKENGITAREEIQNSSSFSTTVLLTTEVMDNGINIKDPSVTHLLTSGTEQISVIQQIGRVRMLSENDRLTVLLPDRGKKSFYDRMKGANLILEIMRKFQNANEKQITELGVSGSLQKIGKCLYKNQLTCEYHLNPFAFAAYSYYANEYSRMLMLMETDEKAWVKQVLSWLGKNYDPVREADVAKEKLLRSELLNLLASVGSDSLSDEAYDNLRIQISDYIRQIYGNDLTHGHSKRIPGSAKINTYIRQYGYEFRPDGQSHHMLCKYIDDPVQL